MDTYDYAFKYIIVGDAGVGKSSIMKRYTSDTFIYDNMSTIGVDFDTKSIMIDGKIIQIQIWDTAGQERFRAITKQYYNNTIGAILVFDITRRNTYKHVEQWLDNMNSFLSPNVNIVLVGNKSDSETHREVSYEEASALAKANKIRYIEVSAKNNTHIDDIFVTSANEIFKLVKDGHIIPSALNSGVKLGEHMTIGNINIGINPPKNKCCK